MARLITINPSMWSIIGLMTVLSTITLGARGHDGFICLSDSNQLHGVSHGGSIDPDTAKLLLGRRMASSQSSLLQSVSEKEVELLDQFGGWQADFFGDVEGDRHPRRMLVIIDGLDSATSTFR
jgi:hypothetical protein